MSAVPVVILAAGGSVRMGRPKQLLPYRGRPLLQHVIDQAAASSTDEVMVVLGHAAKEVLAAISLPPHGRAVVNPDYASGQASSLRAGLGALAPEAVAALILMGDQPELPRGAIEAARLRYRETGGPVVRAEYGGKPGHPVILDRGIWPEAAGVTGDAGARSLLARRPEWVVPLPLPGPPPLEVDTPEDYARLLGEAPPGAHPN